MRGTETKTSTCRATGGSAWLLTHHPHVSPSQRRLVPLNAHLPGEGTCHGSKGFLEAIRLPEPWPWSWLDNHRWDGPQPFLAPLEPPVTPAPTRCPSVEAALLPLLHILETLAGGWFSQLLVQLGDGRNRTLEGLQGRPSMLTFATNKNLVTRLPWWRSG